MYKRDAVDIAYRASIHNSVMAIGAFTIASIQAGLSTCLRQGEKVVEYGLAGIPMTNKRKGIEYLVRNDAYLYQKSMHIADKYGYDSVDGIIEVILLFMRVPNVGMVKAGFIAQMLGFNVACLDSHNLKRLGMTESQTKISKTLSDTAKRRKIRGYVELCQNKGTEYWWDTWCEHVAGNKANRTLDTADVVSRYHGECVTKWHEACNIIIKKGELHYA